MPLSYQMSFATLIMEKNKCPRCVLMCISGDENWTNQSSLCNLILAVLMVQFKLRSKLKFDRLNSVRCFITSSNRRSALGSLSCVSSLFQTNLLFNAKLGFLSVKAVLPLLSALEWKWCLLLLCNSSQQVCRFVGVFFPMVLLRTVSIERLVPGNLEGFEL